MPNYRRARPAIGLFLTSALMVPGKLYAADPVAYTLRLSPTGNGGLDAALAGSSQLAALRKTAPAGPFALVARARADIGGLQTAMDSFGYYQAKRDCSGRFR
jgi:translocation and assembly module TamA